MRMEGKEGIGVSVRGREEVKKRVGVRMGWSS